ncbi:protein AIM2 [Sugiyamaella lignohabitans]|uniref:Protein AIM2 n=1 Tax=Sugiyamaella lignohabitans TaxID=796027 RepID=A0A167CDB6_9ASCO|nr:protein AIM2 [Sugiyamaella lignohabitans]ANB11542.1 protein AIM2 [Sugiyamaella lignohabitans]
MFNGDPYDSDLSIPNPPPGKNFLSDWLPRHMPDTVQPIVDKFVDAVLKKFSPEYVATIGYCYGAKFAVQQIGNGKANVAAMAHPSLVSIEEIAAIKAPLLIIGAEKDHVYNDELRKKTEDKLKEIKATYFTTTASGVSHGFALRGDLSSESVKFAKEKAFTDSLQWFERFAPKTTGTHL